MGNVEGLFAAVRDADVAEVSKLVRSDAENVNAIDDSSGNAPLHMACSLEKKLSKECIKIVQELIKTGHADVNLPSSRNFLPIHIACRHGHDSVVRLLIDAGSFVDNPAGPKRWTPLHFAARYDKKGVSSTHHLLDAGADAMSLDANGNSPLHIAAQYGRFGAASLLIEWGLRPSSQNTAGETPILLAKKHEFPAIVDMFIANLESGTVDRSPRRVISRSSITSPVDNNSKSMSASKSNSVSKNGKKKNSKSGVLSEIARSLTDDIMSSSESESEKESKDSTTLAKSSNSLWKCRRCAFDSSTEQSSCYGCGADRNGTLSNLNTNADSELSENILKISSDTRGTLKTRSGRVVNPVSITAADQLTKKPVCITPTTSEESSCVVCMDNEVDAVILWCGHLCCCQRCAVGLKSCPICREAISKIQKIFRSTS